MNLIRKILSFFSKKETKPQAEAQNSQVTGRMKKTCKNCGKAFSVDPAWEHIPNYCRDCRQKFAREKEERQRAGMERKITRKCRNCGKKTESSLR